VSTLLSLNGAERRKSSIRISLTYTSLSLLLIVDQLLLPMFSVGPVSFKVSYLILGFWLVHWLLRPKPVADESKDIKRVFGTFAVILSCMLLGELWLVSSYAVPSYSDAVRNFLTFMFAAMAFGLGRSSSHFRFEWLLYVFFIAIALNFAFIIFRNDLPSWLIGFYYPERAISDAIGFQSVQDIIALARPRGLFGNPNASMLMVNVIVLAICLAIRNQVLVIRSLLSAACLITLPVLLAAALASRGEFLVSCVFGYLNFHALRGAYGRSLKTILILLIISIVASGIILSDRFSENFSSNVDRILKIGQLLESNEDTASTISRPLIQLKAFTDRFGKSPLIGAGVSRVEEQHLSEGTQYFHNDWFYIASVSGVVGVVSMIWLILFLVKCLGWPILIPFILPGMVNTFVLNVPAFIAYFGMMGLLISATRGRSGSVLLGKNNSV
jgi:hypothetical protein